MTRETAVLSVTTRLYHAVVSGNVDLLSILIVSLFTASGGVLLSGEGDLVQHKLRDRVRELWCHWQQVRLGLIAVLIGDEFHTDGSAVRGSVATNKDIESVT